MNFHDICLPEFIAIFAIGHAEFSTSCASTISGREVRNLDREYARQRYLIKDCRLSNIEFEQFNSFFRARRGQAFAFRFRDPVDCQVFEQLIAKGDGKTQEFQLIKSYNDPIAPYDRIITKPVQDTVSFSINNKAVPGEINYNHGIVTLVRILEKDQFLTGSFLFDVSVRFGSDSFEYSYCSDGSIELSPIELLEVM